MVTSSLIVTHHPRPSASPLAGPLPLYSPAHLPLTPLECTLTERHRVLPVFSRSCPPSSTLESTLPNSPMSVDSKWFPEMLSPLDATLTKNRGVGRLDSQPFSSPTFTPLNVIFFIPSAI